MIDYYMNCNVILTTAQTLSRGPPDIRLYIFSGSVYPDRNVRKLYLLHAVEIKGRKS